MTLFEVLQIPLPAGVSIRFNHADADDPDRHQLVCEVVDLRARYVHTNVVRNRMLETLGERYVAQVCLRLLRKAGVVLPP